MLYRNREIGGTFFLPSGSFILTVSFVTPTHHWCQTGFPPGDELVDFAGFFCVLVDQA